MSTDTRKIVQRKYETGGQLYDEVRWEDPRGRLLSQHDIDLFNRMLPDNLEGKEVVEYGAGTGRFTLPLLERGLRLTATDINPPMVEALQEKVGAKGALDRCRIQVEDVFNLSFQDASFDFAVGIHIIPRFLTLEDQRAALKEITRTLKPGGQLLFNFRNGRSFYARMHRGHTATPAQMEGILRDCGMRIVLKRGKWLLNRKLLNRTPFVIGRGVAAADRALWNFSPDRAWDVFVLAQK